MWRSLCGALLFLGSGGLCWAAEPMAGIADVTIISLQSGINHVKSLTPDGRPGIITKAWRENGNAHGYNLYTVMVRAQSGEPWLAVSFDPKGGRNGNILGLLDIVRDAPHTFEDVVTSVSFARARIDGRKGVIAIIAERALEPGKSIPEPSPVVVSVYRLAKLEEFEIGWPPYYFDLHQRFPLVRQHSDAECALLKELRLRVGEKSERDCAGS